MPYTIVRQDITKMKVDTIVNVEELFMLDAFGEDYLNHRKKVFRRIGRKR